MAIQTAEAPVRVAPDRGPGLSLVLVGGLLGLAWAAGLRGFMAQIVPEDSSVSWSGTFGYILLPGLVIGLLLGWAEHLRRTGGRRRWRWLALSPLLFTAVLFSEGPLGVLGIFEDGLGGGAIGVPLYAMAGGYAIAGRGSRWGRLACGALALTAVPIWALTVVSFAGADLGVTTPRGLWVALYYYSFLALAMIAAAIPYRPTIDA
jgi:MFS family permease